MTQPDFSLLCQQLQNYGRDLYEELNRERGTVTFTAKILAEEALRKAAVLYAYTHTIYKQKE